MSFLRFSALFLVMISVFSSAPVQAASWWDWIFPPKVKDQSRVYLYDGKQPHSHLWSVQDWAPEEWAASRGTVQGVLDDLFSAGILTDRYARKKVPSFEVGPAFFDLSPVDRAKVAKFLDFAYDLGVESSGQTIALYHHKAREVVAYYTRDGLQMQ